jgi:mycothiol synthase
MTTTDEALPTGYTVRAPTMDDVRAVHELAAACSIAVDGDMDFTLEEIRWYWEERVANLTTDALVIVSVEGQLVSVADAARRSPDRLWCYANVHPRHRSRGLGTYLLRWAEARMRQWAADAPAETPVTARQEVSAKDASAVALLDANGYAPLRRSWRMVIELSELPAQPAWPEGITVRAFVVGQDEYAVYEAMEEAFAEHWGHVPVAFEQYAASHFQRESFDPSLTLLAIDGATDGATVAGAALGRRRPDMGWVGGLGVRPAYRRRGLGMALLRHAFGELYRRGERTVGLAVDAENPTGAVRLYEQAGMRPTREWVEYAKELCDDGRPR